MFEWLLPKRHQHKISLVSIGFSSDFHIRYEMNPNSAYYELKFYTIGLCEECNLIIKEYINSKIINVSEEDIHDVYKKLEQDGIYELHYAIKKLYDMKEGNEHDN